MSERRPVQNAKQKFDWLVGVGRDPAAGYCPPLAIELAITHFNNDTGRCDPGDDTLAKNLKSSTKKIQRMRAVLIATGHIEHQLNPAGRRKGWHSNHVLLQAAPLVDTRVSSNQVGLVDSFDGITGQFEHRLVDSQNPRSAQNQSLSSRNQIQKPDSLNQIRKIEHAKTQRPYRETTGNPAAVQREKARAVLRKYGLD